MGTQSQPSAGGRADTGRAAVVVEQKIPVSAKLKVGVIVPSGDPGAAFGIPVQQDPDTSERNARALVDEINATGGIGGRKLEAVFARDDRTDESASTQTRIQNEICTHLTEDEKVFIVLPFYSTLYANECYVKHKTAVLGPGFSGDEEDYRKFAPWFLPALSLNISRMARLLPISFRDQGFLTKKMGLIGFDTPSEQRPAEKYLIPGIQRYGGKVIDKVYTPVSPPEITSAMAAAVLRFKQSDIDRVVVWSGSNGQWLIFSRQAEAQGYRPRYGISTRNDPAAAPVLFQPEQMLGAVGAGFFPALDVRDYQGPPTAKEKACWAIINRRTGSNYQNKGSGTDTVPILALRQCDVFFQLRAALVPAKGKPLQPSDAVGYAERLGTTYDPVSVPRSRFGPGRIDGIDAYANLAWDTRCGCFLYRTSFRDLPF